MYINNLALALGLAGSIAPASAFFRMSCPGRLVRERIDPIVNPGAVGGHVHTISGGSAFGPSMTFQQARAAKCSSCEIKEDMSNYWTPQLYVHAKNGSFFPVPVVGDGGDTNGGMTVYYLQRTGSSGEKLNAFPEGFRMLAGDPYKRNFTGGLDAKAVSFACLGANKAETNEIPNYNCPGGLRAQVFFPACWNGKDLDTADHKSHMSYPAGGQYNSGPCPPEFPKHMISIFFEVLYDTNKFVNEWNGNQHPFVFSNGDPTGYGFHGDFVNGWDVPVLQKAVDTCLDDSGSVAKCGAVTMFTASECNACKLPTVVNEQVDGMMDKLPGCNPVTTGPGRAAPVANCPTTPLSAPSTNFVDLTTSKKWEYTGCGTDNIGSRTFTGKSTSSDDMTVEKCVDFCSGAGFSYAGLEYGRECYCDNTLKAEAAPKDGIMGSCTMKCMGNNKEFCGNGGALSIYHKCGATCKNQQIGGGDTAPAPSASAAAVSSPATLKPSSSSAPTPVKSSSSLKTSVVSTKAPATTPSAPKTTTAAAPKPTKAPDCPQNNCVRQMFNPTASVPGSKFCPTYTASVNTDPKAIPTYLGNCSGPSEVSQACSCLMYATPTPSPKVRRHARDI
ncbi:WSC-domain-containing protein [Lindgomyces ingoldianus]|uniref:WSC-domain-containing protein n=1 Tax=Lindgomyces ingoldianus TaxID=673940 RepID=A0ACB6QVD0_9PLEO|nr:WSC-domain-containing protein [Lindgomyces ingoldianus]KAF2470030.1 WSC-domain-containing protein [Lindgomyces ingoldianus]